MTTARKMPWIAFAALAMLALTSPTAKADTGSNLYMWCSATISTNNSYGVLAIELPNTPGYTNFVWIMGNVPYGGVKDSFYDGGPGMFKVKNVGGSAAYVYLETFCLLTALPFVAEWRAQAAPPVTDSFHYCLALATNVMAVAPTWKPLNHELTRNWGPYISVLGAFLGYALPGEYLVFDLKFWAPAKQGNPTMTITPYYGGDREVGHLLMFEASSFPLWAPLD